MNLMIDVIEWYRKGVRKYSTSLLEDLLAVIDDPVYRDAIKAEIKARETR